MFLHESKFVLVMLQGIGTANGRARRTLDIGCDERLAFDLLFGGEAAPRCGCNAAKHDAAIPASAGFGRENYGYTGEGEIPRLTHCVLDERGALIRMPADGNTQQEFAGFEPMDSEDVLVRAPEERRNWHLVAIAGDLHGGIECDQNRSQVGGWNGVTT